MTHYFFIFSFLTSLPVWSSTPKAIEIIEKNYRLNPWVYDEAPQTQIMLEFNSLTIFPVGFVSGGETFLTWQPSILGYTVGLTKARFPWSALRPSACSACLIEAPPDDMSPDAQWNLDRANDGMFDFTLAQLGVNYASPFHRKRKDTLMQLRGTVLLGEAFDQHRRESFSLRGISVGGFASFALNRKKNNWFFNIGYSFRFARLEGSYSGPEIERILFIRMSHAVLGITHSLSLY